MRIGREGSKDHLIFWYYSHRRFYFSTWVKIWHKGFRVRISNMNGWYIGFFHFDLRGKKCQVCKQWYQADEDHPSHLPV